MKKSLIAIVGAVLALVVIAGSVWASSEADSPYADLSNKNPGVRYNMATQYEYEIHTERLAGEMCYYLYHIEDRNEAIREIERKYVSTLINITIEEFVNDWMAPMCAGDLNRLDL